MWLTSPHVYMLLPSLTLIHREKSMELGGAWRCAPAPTFLPPSIMGTKGMYMAKNIFACVQMFMRQWGSLLLLYTMTQHHLTCSSGQSQDSGELSPFACPLNPDGLNGTCGKDRKDTNNQCSPPVVTVARTELPIQSLTSQLSFHSYVITSLVLAGAVQWRWCEQFSGWSCSILDMTTFGLPI